MADVIYLGLLLAFFGLSWALVRLCERLGEFGSNSPGPEV